MKEITLGNTKVTLVFPNQSELENKKQLEKIYDVCNEIFKNNKECFYTHKEVENLKKNPRNLFI